MISLSKRFWLVVVLALTGAHAGAATYYVDASIGNDSASGLSAAVDTSGNGPWRTVQRVNQAPLQPGDAVLFKCGQTWSETLAPLRSGTQTQSIRFGSQPYGCADKPRISGYERVFADSWVREADGAWRASLPQNLVRNGALQDSISFWQVWSTDGSARLWFPSKCVASTQRCMATIAGANPALVSSSSFALQAGVRYSIRLSVRSEPGQVVTVNVRQDSGAFASLAPAQRLVGDGSWKTLDFALSPAASEPSVRLDLEMPKSSITYLRGVSVQSDQVPAAPVMVADGLTMLEAAHHPNRGVDAAKPNSLFQATASASGSVLGPNGRYGSKTVNIGTSLTLPPGGALVPGLGITVRNNMWAISSHKIESVAADQKSVNLDSLTTYPLTFSGLGYYLTGARWMLDADGEWFFDSTQRALYVRTWSGQAPGDQVTLSSLPAGVNLKARSFIVVEDLAISGAVDGIQASNSEGIELRRVAIDGVVEVAVSALAAKGLKIDAMAVNGAGRVGLLGWDSDAVTVTGSSFANIGVISANGRRLSLPRSGEAALVLGSNAVVRGNRLVNLGYAGIATAAAAVIDDNSLTDICLVLNDCGGIMLDKQSVGSTVTGNLVLRAEGNVDGLPAAFYSHSVGIYADNNSSQITIRNNRVSGVDFGMQVHDSSNLNIDGNVLFANRRYQLWIQETTNKVRAAGDVNAVSVTNNAFFPTVRSAVVRHGTVLSTDLSDMSTFAGNRYATMFTDWAVLEYTASTSATYTLPQWQAVTTGTGISRNNDLGARIAAPLSGFAKGSVQASVLPNSEFQQAASGWSKWNTGSTAPSLAVEQCQGATSPCLKLVSSGTASSVSSPAFAIVKDTYYRYTFDAFASSNGVVMKSMVRRAGATSYASLEPEVKSHALGASWQRYSVTFKATGTGVPNPGANDLGSRLDFLEVPVGVTVWIRNVELNPLNIDGNLTSGATMLANAGADQISVGCPDAGTTLQYRCGSYVRFPEGSAVSWPVVLLPRQAQVVFIQSTQLTDADQDGIPDAQDACPSTLPGQVVNARGCAINQP